MYVQRIFVAFAFCQGALLFKVLENFVKSFIIHAAKVKIGTFAIQQSRKKRRHFILFFNAFHNSFFFFTVLENQITAIIVYILRLQKRTFIII